MKYSLFKDFLDSSETIHRIEDDTNALESSTQVAASTVSQLVNKAENQKVNASAIAIEELKSIIINCDYSLVC